MQAGSDIGHVSVLFPGLQLLGRTGDFFKQGIAGITADTSIIMVHEGIQLIIYFITQRLVDDYQLVLCFNF